MYKDDSAVPRSTDRYNPFFRQLLFLIVLIATACIIFNQLSFFVGSFLGAFTIYVVFRRFLFFLTDKRNWRSWIASLFIILINTLILAGLGYMMFKIISSEVTGFDTQSVMTGVNGLVDQINQFAGFKIIPSNFIEKSEGLIQKVVTAIFNTTYSFTANIFMMMFILYFMLSAGHRMENTILKFAPFKASSLCLLKREVKNMIFSNAVLMPIILVAQTFVSTLIYWLLGVDNYWFWGFLTSICGLVPLLGNMLVYIPMSVYLLATGEVWQGLVLFGYGAIIISNTDNLIRILFLRSVADTHPLVVIIGVILGIPLFGFWGIIFGPLMISAFMLLIKIYYVEYGLIEPTPQDLECAKPNKKPVPKHLKGIADRAEKYNSRRTLSKTNN